MEGWIWRSGFELEGGKLGDAVAVGGFDMASGVFAVYLICTVTHGSSIKHYSLFCLQ